MRGLRAGRANALICKGDEGPPTARWLRVVMVGTSAHPGGSIVIIIPQRGEGEMSQTPRARHAGAHGCPSVMLRTMSIARRIKVIEASSVRKAAWEESVTFSMAAS